MNAATLESQLSARRIGGLQYRVFLLSFLVIFFDGFDTQVISYVAPMIARQWHFAPSAMAPVFSAGLFGVMLGAIFLSPLADRVGRRRIIIPATFAFAVLSFVTAWSQSLLMLGSIRFLTGVALGAALANAISLASDYSPTHRRGAVTMVVTSGVSLGSIASGLLAARLGPLYGWQAVFIVGGTLPFLLALLMIAILPESIPLLLRLDGTHEKARAMLARTLGEEPIAIAAGDDATHPSVGALFTPELRRTTPLLWLGFAATMLTLYLIVNWLPTILTSIGFSPPVAAATTTFYHVGAIVGTFSLALIIDRIGPRRAVLVANAIGIVSLLTYAVFMQSAAGATPLYLIGIGFGTVGGQIALIALSAATYGSFLRATGLGWGLGIGRIGSIAGPLLGGLMIARGISPETMLQVCAASIAVVAIAALAIRSRARWGRSPAAVAP